jgi:hypothetical protein
MFYGSAAVKLLQQVETPGCDMAEEGALCYDVNQLAASLLINPVGATMQEEPAGKAFS